MFQFPTFPSYTLLYSCMDRLTFPQPEFPHSDIHGSQDICSLPWLFAAYHVLLRLLVPRYPPYALCSLTVNVFLRLCFSDSFGLIVRTIFNRCLSSSVFRLPLSDFRFSTLVYLSSIYLYIFQCAFTDIRFLISVLVGSNGIEPSTSRLSGVRSNHLSYEPIFVYFANN